MSLRKKIFLFTVAIIVGISIGYIGFSIQHTATNEKIPVVKNTAKNKNVWITKQDSTLNQNENIIQKEWVQWQKPTDIGDLGWTDTATYQGFSGIKDIKNTNGDIMSIMSNGIHYVQVGKVTQGNYSDYNIIILYGMIGESMPGTNFSMNYFLVRDTSIVMLPSARGKSEFPLDEIPLYLTQGPKKAVDTETTIESLTEYSQPIQGKNSREQFDPVNDDDFFFTTNGLMEVSSNMQMGTIWTKNNTKPVENPDSLNRFMFIYSEEKINYNEPIRSGGYYLRRPDGTAAVYKLHFDIFDMFDRTGILQVTWNNGKKNSDIAYEEFPGGCGIFAYTYDFTEKMSDSDIVPVGKTRHGDILYGYASTSHPEFQKLYRDIYWVMDGKTKLSEKQFLETYPQVFWKNPFGRLLSFYKADIISPAECGKPVIYLYPEQTTDISVKVHTSHITKSDPEYGNGWEITATPNSIITDKTTGKTHPYLFWEGQSDALYSPSEKGFVTANTNLEVFFEKKLAELGLNAKEISDFMGFWIQKMREENKPYYFITFLAKTRIDALAPIEITPKPDTVIRIMMDYNGLSEWKHVDGYPLKTPKRKGFTVVEWGGMLRQ